MIKRGIAGQLIVAALALYVVECAAREPSPCEVLPGTSQDIAATPRLDENLELLALRLSEGITANEAIYRRLVRDITAIRAQVPAVQDIQYFAPFDGRTLHVELDDQAYAQVRAGGYHEWDCLNRHYHLVDTSLSSGNRVSLTFRGRFNLPMLSRLYATVPGVKLAEPVYAIGGGPTIYVTPDAESWHYVFDDASGDCPAGCSKSDAYYFLVEGDLTPKFIARWESASSSVQPPQWVEEYLVDTRRRWHQQLVP